MKPSDENMEFRKQGVLTQGGGEGNCQGDGEGSFRQQLWERTGGYRMKASKRKVK